MAGHFLEMGRFRLICDNCFIKNVISKANDDIQVDKFYHSGLLRIGLYTVRRTHLRIAWSERLQHSKQNSKM